MLYEKVNPALLIYWLTGNKYGFTPSCWSMIDKPVGDNTNTHSRAILLIIIVVVWCLTGLINGNSGVYGPAFATGWNCDGIEDN